MCISFPFFSFRKFSICSREYPFEATCITSAAHLSNAYRYMELCKSSENYWSNPRRYSSVCSYEYFIVHPNFIGFNYAEQFWGFDDSNDRLSPKWTDRMDHFANLLKLNNRYGWYLLFSWCGNQWSPPVNPIGLMKDNTDFVVYSKNSQKNIYCK